MKVKDKNIQIIIGILEPLAENYYIVPETRLAQDKRVKLRKCEIYYKRKNEDSRAVGFICRRYSNE